MASRCRYKALSFALGPTYFGLSTYLFLANLTMKFSSTIILPAAMHGLVCAAVSLPRADNVCKIEGTSANVYCREGPSRKFSSVVSARPGQAFAVRCMTTEGESIDGET